MSKWGKVRKKLKRNIGKIAGVALSYYYGVNGNIVGKLLDTGKNYVIGKNVHKKVYDYYTGHYQRQQERAEKNQQKAEEYEIERQKAQALRQRKEQINELRERIGAGGTRYRTDKQDRRAAKSIYSSGNHAETLG